MLKLSNPLALVGELGASRMKLLVIITGGHFGIHWFQQLFPVVLPSLKTQLELSDVQLGALSSVRQLVNGGMDLPCGILADSLSRYRAPFLASALLSMGVGYSLMGVFPAFAWVLVGCGLIGLGTALWHPAAAASLSNNFPERRATALSIHGMGATISDTLTPLLAGFVLISASLSAFLAVQLAPALLIALSVGAVWHGNLAERNASAFFRAYAGTRGAGKEFHVCWHHDRDELHADGATRGYNILTCLSSGTPGLLPIRARRLHRASSCDGNDFSAGPGLSVGSLGAQSGALAVVHGARNTIRFAHGRGAGHSAGLRGGRYWSLFLYPA